MGFVSRDDFKLAGQAFMKQGQLVTYVLPYARPDELIGPQTGVVLSSDSYNRTHTQLCICPILCGQTSINETLGIKVPFSGQSIYLRPDLSSFIGIKYGKVQGLTLSNRNIAWDSAVEQAIAARNAILTPTHEKIREPAKGFLGFGQMGWSAEFPYTTDERISPAPVINLTSPKIYGLTGMAIVGRTYSHTENFCDRRDVAIDPEEWFRGGFIPSTGTKAVSIKRLMHRSGKKPIHISYSALKGIAKKSHANMDADARDANAERYTASKGVLPARMAYAHL